ncbi:MAG: hypothetical protein KIT81_04310 [Alphaproteobacteria bacterium]|nr:hypothetical protein [Alphaproteobacteria bacterium]
MDAVYDFLSFLRELLGTLGRMLALGMERFDYVDYLFLLQCVSALIIVHLWFRNQHLGRQFEWLRQNLARLAGHGQDELGAGAGQTPATAEIWVAIDRIERNIREIETAFHDLLADQTGLAQEMDRLKSEAGNMDMLPAPPAPAAPAALVPLTPPPLPAPSPPAASDEGLRLDSLEVAFAEIRNELTRLKLKIELPRIGDPLPSRAEVEQIGRRTELLSETVERLERQAALMLERIAALDNVAANMRSAIRTLRSSAAPKFDGLPELVGKLEQGYGDLQKARAEMADLARVEERRQAILRESLGRLVELKREFG